MTLNGVMAVTLRYFSEVGKPALQKTICGGIYARVYCNFSACTMSSQRKFTRSLSHLLMSFLFTNLPRGPSTSCARICLSFVQGFISRTESIVTLQTIPYEVKTRSFPNSFREGYIGSLQPVAPAVFGVMDSICFVLLFCERLQGCRVPTSRWRSQA